jgi:hypothetical protein
MFVPFLWNRREWPMTTRDEVIAALADPGDKAPRETAARWLGMSPRAMSNWAVDDAGHILSRDVLDRALAALWRREAAAQLEHRARVAEFRERNPRGGRPPSRKHGWKIPMGLVGQLAQERCSEVA